MSLKFFKSLVVAAASSEPGKGAITFTGLHKSFLLDLWRPLAEISALDPDVQGSRFDAWWAMKLRKFYNNNNTPDSKSSENNNN